MNLFENAERSVQRMYQWMKGTVDQCQTTISEYIPSATRSAWHTAGFLFSFATGISLTSPQDIASSDLVRPRTVRQQFTVDSHNVVHDPYRIPQGDHTQTKYVTKLLQQNMCIAPDFKQTIYLENVVEAVTNARTWDKHDRQPYKKGMAVDNAQTVFDETAQELEVDARTSYSRIQSQFCEDKPRKDYRITERKKQSSVQDTEAKGVPPYQPDITISLEQRIKSTIDTLTRTLPDDAQAKTLLQDVDNYVDNRIPNRGKAHDYHDAFGALLNTKDAELAQVIASYNGELNIETLVAYLQDNCNADDGTETG